jgi:hypothetical protein
MSDPTVLEIGLQALLAGVGGSTGAYGGGYAPQSAVAPFLTYQRISADRDFHLQGPTGMADVRMQIDAYAATYLQARQVAGAVRQLLDGYLGTSVGVKITASRLISDLDVFEPDTDPKLFRVSMDYLISHDET